jgi:hypothetical protein
MNNQGKQTVIKTINQGIDAAALLGFKVNRISCAAFMSRRRGSTTLLLQIEDADQWEAALGTAELDCDREGSITFNGGSWEQFQDFVAAEDKDPFA